MNQLHNSSKTKVDAVPYELFLRKDLFSEQSRVYVNIVSCKNVFRLYLLLLVYIAALRKRTTISKPDTLNIREFD